MNCALDDKLTIQKNKILNTADEHQQAIVKIIEALSRTFTLIMRI